MTPPFGSLGSTHVVAFWAMFCGWAAAEAALGWLSRPPADATRRDRGSLVVATAAAVAGVGLALALSDLLPAPAFIASGQSVIFIAGVLLVLAGVAIRWYSAWMLAGAFSFVIATRPGQLVVDEGPYRYVRHPSYTGGGLAVLGLLVCCANPAALLGLIPVGLGLAYRIHAEEAALIAEHGDAYRDYMRRTQRLVPFLI